MPHSNYRSFTFHFNAVTHGTPAQEERAAHVLGVKPEHLAGIARTQNRLPALRKCQARVAELEERLHHAQLRYDELCEALIRGDGAA